MKNEELNIQSAIVRFLRLNNIMVFSIPNGTNIKNVGTRALMKRSGLLSGASDLLVVTPQKVLFVEIKTTTGRLSDNQKAFRESVQDMGYEYLVWRSLEDANDWLIKCSVFNVPY